MSRCRLQPVVSFAFAACLLVCLTPETVLAQFRWTVTVVSARSETTTICTNQTFSFELTGSTGSSSNRVCNADVRFTVAATTATLQLVSNVAFYGCTWQPVGTVAGTGFIVGDAVGDTTFSGSMRTTGSYYCNSTNPITITFRASRQSTTGPPVITTHPSNTSAARGATASFSCAASGNPAPDFQWQRLSASGTFWEDLGEVGPFGGVTSTTLTVSVPTEGTAVQTGDQFRCVAENDLGSATSNAALLTINEPPYIITHPQPATVLYGDTATFTVRAGGTPAPSYRWQWLRAGSTTWNAFLYDTGGFQGSQTATLTVPTGASGGQNGDQFRAVATNSLGNATSNPATLSVTTAAPSFTTHPSDTAAVNGASTTFTVAVTGRPTPTLQWLRSPAGSTAWEEVSAASPYSGVTGTTLTISAVTAAMHGDRFRARALNLAGTVESNVATLSIAVPPVFTLHPASAEANEGGSISFHVTATGIPAPTFQWQVDRPGPPPQGGSEWSALSDSASYAGTATDTLTVQVVRGELTGSAFRAVATNIAGSATSTSATLTVVLCTQTLDLTGRTFPAGGGEGTVSITTAPAGWNCAWTAYSNAAWIRLRASAADVSGTNAGSVTYDVMPNLSTTARTGTVSIGRQRHTVSQAAGRIELVDPNPTLIDHRTYALFSSRDLVAAEVASGRLRARTGTSTDGVSVLLVSVASEVSLTFRLVTIGGRLEQVTGEAGSEFQPGGAAGDRRVVAVYRPPAYFGSTATTQTVFVEFANPLVSGDMGRVSITLERPPLVLVHGQWDSAELWRTTGFEAAMQASGFRTFNADYRDYAGVSFDPAVRPQRQVELVQREIENALRVTRDAGIAAAQVDVVAHSMGGLVTRVLIQQPACPVSLGQPNRQCYRHVSNFNLGWVRRLVTLGTPHNGSPVGKVLYDNRDVTLSVYGPLGETLVPLKWVVRALTGGSLEGGSAQALSPGSSAYSHLLATPGCAAGDTLSVPTYGLIGDYRPAGTVRLRTVALSLLMRGLTGQAIDDVFGEANDLMVGVSSQWGRGAVVTFPTGAYFGSTVHSASLGSAPADGLYAEAENPDVRQKVATLLNSELNSSAAPFGCFSRPWALPALDPPAPARGASAVSQGRIRITSPGFSDVITHGTGMRLTLTVEPVGGTVIRDLVFAIGNVLMVPGPSAAPYSVTVDLPASLPLGSLDVVAYALDTNDALLVDMRTVTVQAADTPSAIRVTPTTLALSAGEELGQQLRVFGTFVRNGASVELDVSSASLGTRYAARLGSAVVTITDEGVVTAAGVGTDVIDITASGGLTASVPVTVACVVAASPVAFTVAAAGSTETLTLTMIGGDCPWGLASRVDWITIDSVSSWTGPSTITFRVAANRGAAERTGSLWVTGQSITVTQAAAPTTMSVSPSTLRFAAAKNGADGAIASVTGAQAVTVAVSGATPPWTATADQPWVQITGGAATGSGIFTVQIVNPDNVIGGATTLAATVTVAASTTLSATVQVTLVVGPAGGGGIGMVGQVDTPLQDAAGVVGAIGVTGWVLDDIGATGVKIYRNCLSFDDPESCQTVLGHSVVFVGDAAFLTGARPDVEAAFATHPQNNRAGWGYLMLTSMLPHVTGERAYGGQGALTIYAVATDVEGHQKLLGRSSDASDTANFSAPTRITIANDSIAKPFGAIDTPAQGATVSGVLNNFGWALTPDSNATGGEAGDIVIPTDGSTVTVFIDSLPVAQVVYNQCRGGVGNPVPAGLYCDDDVANIFGNATPQPTFTVRTSNPTRHRNLDAACSAIGSFTINTATLSNGLHTIAWSVTDSAGRTEGIGSRFFNVLNGGGGRAR